MNADWQTLLWLGLGMGLAASELLLPGMVVIFLGLGALLVALLRWLGLITTLPQSVLVWMVATTILALVLRNYLLRFFPPDKSYTPYRPDLEDLGTEVDVVETVRASDANGRVRHGGTTWQAQSLGEEIPAGGRARLVTRQDLVWMVAPVERDSGPKS